MSAPCSELPIRREEYAKDILVWMALSFFRHWFAQRIIDKKGSLRWERVGGPHETDKASAFEQGLGSIRLQVQVDSGPSRIRYRIGLVLFVHYFFG